MIEAFKPVSEEQKQIISELLKESSLSFAPFGDPLWADFGAHRWLSHAREEVYSDWLQWIFEQIKSPEHIFTLLLGKTDRDLEDQCKGRLKVNREFGIADEEGGRRRTDLELFFGEK